MRPRRRVARSRAAWHGRRPARSSGTRTPPRRGRTRRAAGRYRRTRNPRCGDGGRRLSRGGIRPCPHQARPRRDRRRRDRAARGSRVRCPARFRPRAARCRRHRSGCGRTARPDSRGAPRDSPSHRCRRRRCPPTGRATSGRRARQPPNRANSASATVTVSAPPIRVATCANGISTIRFDALRIATSPVPP